jgi:hypothetical protein
MLAGRSSSTRPAIRSGKACKNRDGRKTPQERGEDPLLTRVVNKHAGLRKWVQCHLSQCAWKGESLHQRLVHRRTLSKQSLRSQVSVKLAPEICINNTSSNSRGSGQASHSPRYHLQNCLETLFFFSPYLWWDNNLTTPACWKTYWNCIAIELGTLCGIFFVCVQFCSILCFPFDETTTEQHLSTISRIGGWGTNTKIIKTETSLHLNLAGFFYFLFYFLIHFYFYLLCLYIFFFHLLIFHFYSYLYSFYFLFLILSL